MREHPHLPEPSHPPPGCTHVAVCLQGTTSFTLFGHSHVCLAPPISQISMQQMGAVAGFRKSVETLFPESR